jgi:mRNA interferase MazF
MSAANVQGIASIPSVRLERSLGAVPEHTLSEIRRALSFALNLDDH